MATPASSLFSTACSVFGYRVGTETPKFSVVDRVGRVVIRRYDERLAAGTVVDGMTENDARREGFKRLAGYIFGGNTTQTRIAMTTPVSRSSQKIVMTAPVAQQQVGQGIQIRFFLPSTLTLATAPRPGDTRVTLEIVPPEDYAVLHFSNSRSESAVDAHSARLGQLLSGSDWQPTGAPVAWFYDPPWTLPFLRRNEVALPVRAMGATGQVQGG